MLVKNIKQGVTDFNTIFSCDKNEQKQLIEYLNFIIEDNVYQKVMENSQFAPSELWTDWLSNTFVGFSSDSILLKSGHKFTNSSEPIYVPAFTDGNIGTFLRRAYVAIRKYFALYQSDKLSDYSKKFNSMYPNSITPSRHHEFLNTHTFNYLKSLEILNLTEINNPRYTLEIGAGACTNIALLKDVYKTKSLVIDLPETIIAGYLFLKSIFPEIKIGLPQDHGEALDMSKFDIAFVLPYQVDIIPNDTFDVAYNMASFQEMKIDVVNNYIALIHRVLKKGGHIISSNQEISRHIEGNSFKNYQLESFAEEKREYPPFGNFSIRHLTELKGLLYQGRKV